MKRSCEEEENEIVQLQAKIITLEEQLQEEQCNANLWKQKYKHAMSVVKLCTRTVETLSKRSKIDDDDDDD